MFAIVIIYWQQYSLWELKGLPKNSRPEAIKMTKENIKEKAPKIRLCSNDARQLVKFHEWTLKRNWRSRKVKNTKWLKGNGQREMGERRREQGEGKIEKRESNNRMWKARGTEIEASSSWPPDWVENSKEPEPWNRRKIALPDFILFRKWRKLHPLAVPLLPTIAHLCPTRQPIIFDEWKAFCFGFAAICGPRGSAEKQVGGWAENSAQAEEHGVVVVK